MINASSIKKNENICKACADYFTIFCLNPINKYKKILNLNVLKIINFFDN